MFRLSYFLGNDGKLLPAIQENTYLSNIPEIGHNMYIPNLGLFKVVSVTHIPKMNDNDECTLYVYLEQLCSMSGLESNVYRLPDYLTVYHFFDAETQERIGVINRHVDNELAEEVINSVSVAYHGMHPTIGSFLKLNDKMFIVKGYKFIGLTGVLSYGLELEEYTDKISNPNDLFVIRDSRFYKFEIRFDRAFQECSKCDNKFTEDYYYASLNFPFCSEDCMFEYFIK